MMRNPTSEELELRNKLYYSDTPLTEEEKKAIIKKLKEIDDEETKNWPFCH